MKSKLQLDWQLILPVFILFSLSLASLYSIQPQTALFQLFFLLISLPLFLLFSSFHYQDQPKLAPIYAIGSLIFLILPFVFGVVTRGSLRWIQIGSFTLQPSELVKPFLVIIFASFLNQQKKAKPLSTLFTYLSLLIIPAFLVFKQPDLGSSLVIMFSGLSILFISQLPLIYFTLIFLLAALILPLTWKLLRNYQKQRLTSFLNPYADPRGSGYNIIQSLIAVGAGGLWGRGLGRGLQSQLQFLPERHTDFIFATIAEELGLFGGAILLLAYFGLLFRIFMIARRCQDNLGRLIAIGIFALLFFQGTVNIAMNLGLLPITGVTLPFVSAGGSSMLASIISLGIINNISSQQKHRPTFEIK